MVWPPPLWCFILHASLWVSVDTLTVNRTIDDTFGDPTTGAKPIYLPEGLWDNASCSPSKCAILPPTQEAFDQTYTAATYLPNQGARSIQFSFTGTAVYVYFILANDVPNAGTETICNFTLDGQDSGGFQHGPSTSSAYQYNALVFSRDGLLNNNHILYIYADGYSTLSFINFDRAVYTFDDDDSISGEALPTSALATSPQQHLTSAPIENSSVIITSFQITETVISGSTVSTIVPQQATKVVTIPNPSPSSSSISASGVSPSATNNSITILHSHGPSSSSATPTNKSVVVGATIGSVIGGVTLALALGFILYRRRRKLAVMILDSNESLSWEVAPFTPMAPTNSTIHPENHSTDRSDSRQTTRHDLIHPDPGDTPSNRGTWASNTHSMSEEVIPSEKRSKPKRERESRLLIMQMREENLLMRRRIVEMQEELQTRRYSTGTSVHADDSPPHYYST